MQNGHVRQTTESIFEKMKKKHTLHRDRDIPRTSVTPDWWQSASERRVKFRCCHFPYALKCLSFTMFIGKKITRLAEIFAHSCDAVNQDQVYNSFVQPGSNVIHDHVKENGLSGAEGQSIRFCTLLYKVARRFM